jgi:hypothetical protein
MYNAVSNNNGVYSPLYPLQTWLDNIDIQEEKLAKRIVKLIPSQCPFAREIRLFNQVILRIPPLCKLNPCYDQLIGLRFRALCFLVDKCNEDITQYCL